MASRVMPLVDRLPARTKSLVVSAHSLLAAAVLRMSVLKVVPGAGVGIRAIARFCPLPAQRMPVLVASYLATTAALAWRLARGDRAAWRTYGFEAAMAVVSFPLLPRQRRLGAAHGMR
jgi:hypothetical protein